MESDLRRRVFGSGVGGGVDGAGADATPSTEASSAASSLTPTPRDDSPARPGEKVKIVHHRHGPPKTRKRRNTFIFLLGSLFGIVLAGFLAKENNLISLPEISEFSMDSFLDILPAGLAKDMRDFVVRSSGGLKRRRRSDEYAGTMGTPLPPILLLDACVSDCLSV